MIPILKRAKELGVDPKTLMMLEWFEEAIAKDPQDAYSYASMGTWWHHKKEYAKAIEHLDRAIQLNPNYASALCARADLRATCPDCKFRDGTQAVKDATYAYEVALSRGSIKGDWRQRMYLRVLAAAYAESGDFQSAILAESEVLALAITKVVRHSSEKRLAQYKNLQPTRADTGIMSHGVGRESDQGEHGA